MCSLVKVATNFYCLSFRVLSFSTNFLGKLKMETRIQQLNQNNITAHLYLLFLSYTSTYISACILVYWKLAILHFELFFRNLFEVLNYRCSHLFLFSNHNFKLFVFPSKYVILSKSNTYVNISTFVPNGN